MYVYRSGNPALSDATFEKSSYSESDWWDDDSHLMSMEGTAEKTAILLIITATAGIATAMMMPAAALLVIVGFLGGFITAMIVIFSGSTNPALICTYAAFEGLALGGMTWFFEQAFPGIGLQAMLLTFLILGSMLLIYRAGLIAWNQNLAIAVFSSLLAIILIYIVSFLGPFFGFEVPYIHGSGTIGIAFSLFVIGIGALCLVADFDFIEKGVERGAPKQLEWRAAFGLMVTLVWLYLEILKLLAKLRSR
jgi:uncharacterized YccA/Bax inhibitor family protein